ncbi:unnamed protein product, partial [Prorocentrum cordatum]
MWTLLMKRFARGHMSASQVQEIAKAAMDSGADRSDVRALARLGAYGNQSGNCHRDLTRAYFSDLAAPQPMDVLTNLRVRGDDGQFAEQEVNVSILCPHDWAQCLGAHDRLDEVAGSAADASEFWAVQDFSNNPQYKHSPYFQTLAREATAKLPKAVITVIAGDIEWFCQEFGFPYAMSNYPCAYCTSDNCTPPGPNPFTDFRRDAKWKATMLSHRDLRAKFKHILFDRVPGVSFYTLKLDCLHVLDLGVACHLYGNLMWEILEDELPGNREASTATLNKAITHAYNELSVPAAQRIPKLDATDIAKSNEVFPLLKHVKGRK